MADTLNFMLGKYIMLAVNAPKKYPKEPVSAKLDAEGGQMTEEDEAKINALMGAFAQNANKLPSADAEAPQDGNAEATQP